MQRTRPLTRSVALGLIALLLSGCGGKPAGTVNATSTVSTTTEPASQAPSLMNLSTATTSSGASVDPGASWAAALDQISKVSPDQKLNGIQIVSWNDYEHGSQIEAGVENGVSVAPSLTDDTLSWTVTGNAATIHHFVVYASKDGENLTPVAELPATASSVNLAQSGLSDPSDYTLFVQAVGMPSVKNKVSLSVRYSRRRTALSASLSLSPNTGTVPFDVKATASSSSSLVSYSIDFGDGTVVNTSSATHTYKAGGKYTVKATVLDESGASASATATVIAAAPNQAPVAKLSVTPASGIAPLAVTATTSGSSDPDGSIASTSIDFGDGTVVNTAGGSHTYSTAGTYTVKATVTDNGGQNSSATATVAVSAPNQAPVAKLSVTPTSGTAPVSVTATTAGSSDPDGTIASTSIDFGDGTVLNAASGSHTYSAAGNYTVKATVTDNGGLSSSAAAAVNVAAPNQAPVAKLSVTPSSGTAPVAVTATTVGSSDPDGTIASTSIDFGDGTVISAASGSHTYSSVGTYTVKATVTDNGGLSAIAMGGVTVQPAIPPGQSYAAYGITFPQAHPRLWFNDAGRLARAQAWYTAHPSYAPTMSQYPDTQSAINIAWAHVASGGIYSCAPAVDFVVGYAANHQPAPQPTDAGSDKLRAVGETVSLVYDWCYDDLTASQRTQLISDWNLWFGNAKQQTWGGLNGGVWMTENNYFWGNFRNEFEWGVATYGDNAQADSFLGYSLNTRWAAAVAAASTSSAGGVEQEGHSYGLTTSLYSIVPLLTAETGGRSLFAENPTFKEEGFFLLYATTPALTWNKITAANDWQFFSFGDDDKQWYTGNRPANWQYGDLMKVKAAYYSSGSGRYFKQWINTLNPVQGTSGAGTTQYVVPELWNTTTALSYSNLALDFYGSGVGYFYGRKQWDTSSTAFQWQLGQATGAGGHDHRDFGSFQIWRGGRWLARETADYSASIPDYNNGANVDIRTPIAHNVPLVNGLGAAWRTGSRGKPQVKRVESQADYAYAVVDLTQAYHADADHSPAYDNTALVHAERELLFIRSLETTVIFDRLAANSTTTKKTFLAHFENSPTAEDATHWLETNGTQALHVSMLVPSAPDTSRIINEAACSGCTVRGLYRLEIDTSGANQSYFLAVLQARDSSAANLTASVVDSNPGDSTAGTFTVTLHPASGSDTTIVFNKGQSSLGGTVNGRALESVVQQVSYTDNGPVWGSVQP